MDIPKNILTIKEITEMCFLTKKHVLELRSFDEAFELIKLYENKKRSTKILKVKDFLKYKEFESYSKYLDKKAQALWKFINHELGSRQHPWP